MSVARGGPLPLSRDGLPPSRWHALIASIGLSLLFLLVYGTCNWFTSTRSDVGTWVYAWERHIPFVPLMIVPYISIDLFFVAAPFFCTSRQELRLLCARIVMAILIAGIFFLAMPLRFTFERPHVDGLLGVVFDWFRGMDQPFNQFPSLHIALRTILADLYARHTRGPVRVASDVWFSLIGASTLLVYQHHVADVVGGFALAALCFYVIGQAGWRSSAGRNGRVGIYYAGASVVCLVIALLARPWTAMLFWPALSAGIVATGYFVLGPAIYRKSDGRLPLSTRVVLAPILLAQWLSLQHYARRSNRWDRVTDHVWIGRALTARDAGDAVKAGVTAVLDLTCEFSAPLPFRNVNYLNLPILDLTAPLESHLTEAIAFISKHAEEGGIVYVHCKAGYSRSAAVVGAYLVRSGHSPNPQAAVKMLREARKGIIIRPEAMRCIEQCIAHA